MESRPPVWLYSAPGCSCTSPRAHGEHSIHKRFLQEGVYEPVRFSPYFTHRYDSQTKDSSRAFFKAAYSRPKGTGHDEESKPVRSPSSFDAHEPLHVKTDKFSSAEETAYDALPSSVSSPARFALGMHLFSHGYPRSDELKGKIPMHKNWYHSFSPYMLN